MCYIAVKYTLTYVDKWHNLVDSVLMSISCPMTFVIRQFRRADLIEVVIAREYRVVAECQMHL